MPHLTESVLVYLRVGFARPRLAEVAAPGGAPATGSPRRVHCKLVEHGLRFDFN